MLLRGVGMRNPEDLPFVFVPDSDPPQKEAKRQRRKWIPAFAGMTVVFPHRGTFSTPDKGSRGGLYPLTRGLTRKIRQDDFQDRIMQPRGICGFSSVFYTCDIFEHLRPILICVYKISGCFLLWPFPREPICLLHLTIFRLYYPLKDFRFSCLSSFQSTIRIYRF